MIEDGGVVIDGEEIVAVGKRSDLQRDYPEASFKNAAGKVIMPGMINTHMHLYSTFARGMDLKTEQAPKNFTEILEKLWWRLDKALNEDDIYYSTLYAILDGIKKGTTTIFDHHASFGQIDGSLDIIAAAVEQAGIRANLAFEVSDRHGPEKAQAALRENERFIKKLQHQKNELKNLQKKAGKKQKKKNWEGKMTYLGGTIGLHASFTLEDETLERAAALADELGVPFHIHTAEGRADLEDSKKRGYRGVVDRLDQFNIWRPGTLAIHGVYLQEEELLILKERNSCLVHNPESNMGNAVGAAPVKNALDRGVEVGLGTDGYTADIFESIKVANLLQKHKLKDPRAGWEEVYRMAFINNREIAGRFFQQELGVLKPGAAADLIIINYSPPTPVNAKNAYSHLLFGVEGSMVETTVVGGRILMENREVKNFDYERICSKVREQARDFWRRF